MATNRKAKAAPDEPVQEDHIVETVVAEIASDHTPELLTLDSYIKRHRPHMGLVASFTYEALKVENGLAPRTEAAWTNDFGKQAKRVYTSF